MRAGNSLASTDPRARVTLMASSIVSVHLGWAVITVKLVSYL